MFWARYGLRETSLAVEAAAGDSRGVGVIALAIVHVDGVNAVGVDNRKTPMGGMEMGAGDPGDMSQLNTQAKTCQQSFDELFAVPAL